jgi:divinyl protochlorophyllide a 8-vinyl-reductase
MVARAIAGLLRPRRKVSVATDDVAEIGPNAILQLLPVLQQAGLEEVVLKRAGIVSIPAGDEMIPQAPAAALHQALRVEAPERAAALAREAGLRTGEYILAHRIPAFAQKMLRVLPRPVAARALSKAIEKHAWTFAGSGQFHAADRWHFHLARNPIVAGERSDVPLCHWHAAVFERLYTALIDPTVICHETACCAQGAAACRFELAHAP